MLLNNSLKKRIKIKLEQVEYICEPVLVDGVEPVPFIDKQTDKWTVEGVTLCRVEQKQP